MRGKLGNVLRHSSCQPSKVLGSGARLAPRSVSALSPQALGPMTMKFKKMKLQRVSAQEAEPCLGIIWKHARHAAPYAADVGMIVTGA